MTKIHDLICNLRLAHQAVSNERVPPWLDAQLVKIGGEKGSMNVNFGEVGKILNEATQVELICHNN